MVATIDCRTVVIKLLELAPNTHNLSVIFHLHTINMLHFAIIAAAMFIQNALEQSNKMKPHRNKEEEKKQMKLTTERCATYAFGS